MKNWNIDPLTYCHYYKKYGCAHIDGYLCNVSDCSILKEYNKDLLRTQKINKLKNKIYELYQSK